MPDKSPRDRISNIAVELRAALERIVLALVGPVPRPSKLVQTTGIDKTLAGRMVRAIRSLDALEALNVFPAPLGLQIFLRAAAEKRVDAALLDDATRAVRRFEALVDEFSGGRAELDATIAGWLPQARARNERSARQAAFKAMSHLLGYQLEATVSCAIVQPSAAGETCDVIHLNGRFGLRRMRMGTQILICGTRVVPPATQEPAIAPVETLDGSTELREPRDILLERFCGQPTPTTHIVRTADRVVLVMDEHEPGLNTPVTLAAAYVSRRSWARYRLAERRREWQSLCPRIPSRVLIFDVLLRNDVYPASEPIITQWVQGVTSSPAFQTDNLRLLDEIKLSYDLRRLGTGLTHVGTGEIPRYPEMLEEVFRRVGWDAARFRVYRLRVEYPVPSVTITMWFDLPARNGAIEQQAGAP